MVGKCVAQRRARLSNHARDITEAVMVSVILEASSLPPFFSDNLLGDKTQRQCRRQGLSVSFRRFIDIEYVHIGAHPAV